MLAKFNDFLEIQVELYGSYCMGMPEAYSQAIQSDAQALIWG